MPSVSSTAQRVAVSPGSEEIGVLLGPGPHRVDEVLVRAVVVEAVRELLRGDGALGELHVLEVAGDREQRGLPRLGVDGGDHDRVGARARAVRPGILAQQHDVQPRSVRPGVRSVGELAAVAAEHGRRAEQALQGPQRLHAAPEGHRDGDHHHGGQGQGEIALGTGEALLRGLGEVRQHDLQAPHEADDDGHHERADEHASMGAERGREAQRVEDDQEGDDGRDREQEQGEHHHADPAHPGRHEAGAGQGRGQHGPAGDLREGAVRGGGAGVGGAVGAVPLGGVLAVGAAAAGAAAAGAGPACAGRAAGGCGAVRDGVTVGGCGARAGGEGGPAAGDDLRGGGGGRPGGGLRRAMRGRRGRLGPGGEGSGLLGGTARGPDVLGGRRGGGVLGARGACGDVAGPGVVRRDAGGCGIIGGRGRCGRSGGCGERGTARSGRIGGGASTAQGRARLVGAARDRRGVLDLVEGEGRPTAAGPPGRGTGRGLRAGSRGLRGGGRRRRGRGGRRRLGRRRRRRLGRGRGLMLRNGSGRGRRSGSGPVRGRRRGLGLRRRLGLRRGGARLRRAGDPGALGVRAAEGRVTVPARLLRGERRGFRASDRLLPVPSGPTAAAAGGREGVRHALHPRERAVPGRAGGCVDLVEVRLREHP